MLSPLNASFLTTAFCCGMDIKKRMPEPSYNRVDCKSPKLRTKTTIFKESPKLATSQTCVSDLKKNKNKNKKEGGKTFCFIPKLQNFENSFGFFFSSLILCGEYTGGERSKECLDKTCAKK